MSNPFTPKKSEKSVGTSARAQNSRPLKVALVCDWLVSVGGAERVLKSLSDLFPSAPIYTSQYNQKKIDWFASRNVRVGWLQIFPSFFRRFLGPLRQAYFNHLDLSDYDLIISVTGAEAKSIKFNPKTSLHLCYCHVPTQYYWGLKEDYEKNPGFGPLNPLVRLALRLLLPPLRSADLAAAQRPTSFITISTYAAAQIRKFYGRDSEIIFPPVAVKRLILTKTPAKSPTLSENSRQKSPKKSQTSVGTSARAQNSRSGFITTSRQVSWKRLDLAIKACLKLNLPLKIVGAGPEHSRLKKLVKKSKNPRARELITFLPQTDRAGLKRYLEASEGYIFPSLEPFGIAPVEALACGCPVIAYGRGGALDYCVDGENGVLFGKQSVSSLCQALKRFRTIKFSEPKIRTSALPFDETIFQEKIKSYISAQLSPTPPQSALKVKPKKSQVSPQTTKKVKSPTPPPTPQKPKPVKPTKKPNPSPRTIAVNTEKPTEKPKQPTPTPKPTPKSTPIKITINDDSQKTPSPAKKIQIN